MKGVVGPAVRLMWGVLFFIALLHVESHAAEISGYIEGEARIFPSSPLYDGQENHSGSVAVLSEFYQELGPTSAMTITPFARLDSGDPNRTHFDLREFFFLLHGEWWEVRAGIDKVFWGVTESVHLVDIVNQTDMLESFDGEEKFGQPMLKLSIAGDVKGIDLFILPLFRERNFAGEGGRLRSEILVEGDEAAYESVNREKSVDFAVRYSYTSGGFDLGISYFKGTGREPSLRLKRNDMGFPEIDAKGNIHLFPYYEQITQAGVDMLLVLDAWLLKLESIYRTGQSDRDWMKNDFASSALGIEYTVYGVAGSGADVGILGEWVYDDRGDSAVSALNNDLMAGLRFSLNDVSGSTALLGYIHDYKNSSSFLTLEGSRRLNDHLKLELQGFYFLFSPEDDPSWVIRRDSFMEARLVWYF